MECWYHFVPVSRWDGTVYGEDVVWVGRCEGTLRYMRGVVEVCIVLDMGS